MKLELMQYLNFFNQNNSIKKENQKPRGNKQNAMYLLLKK
jgi:hypothetical protein